MHTRYYNMYLYIHVRLRAAGAASIPRYTTVNETYLLHTYTLYTLPVWFSTLIYIYVAHSNVQDTFFREKKYIYELL